AVVRKAAQVIDAEHQDRIAAIVEAQRAADSRGDLAEFLRQDEAFHQAIAQTADCEKAWRLLENLKAQMDRVRYLSLDEATPVSVLIEQHAEIAAGLFAHDADRAEAAMKAHLREILTSLPVLAEQHAELFTA